MAALPLHPRRAQQIFCELMQARGDLTPQVAETPLPKRIQRSQERYLRGVYEAKRGATFELVAASAPPCLAPPAEQLPSSSRRVTLRLSRDGSTLDVLLHASPAAAVPIVDAADGDDNDSNKPHEQRLASIQLVNIEQIVVSAGAFALRLRSNGASNQGESDLGDAQWLTYHAVAFAAAGVDELNQWVLTLTCGANAFQQQQQQQNQTNQTRAARDLVWQAARLRIFELAEAIALHEAIAAVTLSVQQLTRGDGDADDGSDSRSAATVGDGDAAQALAAANGSALPLFLACTC